MLFVLYKNSGVHSGRALRQELAKLGKVKVLGGFPKRLAWIQKKTGRPDAIINLGVVDEVGFDGTTLNSQEVVRAISNKKRARQRFQETGVPAPRLFTSAKDVTEADLPVIGRTGYHKKGEGFWLCKTLKEVQRALQEGATHFLEFIPNTREYRVHTFVKGKYLHTPRPERKREHYVSVKISEKVWQGKEAPNPNEPQKNHEFGWTFLGPQNRRADETAVVRHAAKQAAASLGIDFGAVDVMYSVRNKLPYVLEINSTPSLSDDNANTCEIYARRLLLTLQGKDDESEQ